MMRMLRGYGPSLVVLATALLVLLAGPSIVRELQYAQTTARIIQASQRLANSDLLAQLNQAYRDVAEVVEPSVVHISTEYLVQGRTGRPQLAGSSGSGWIFDEAGHIVTNAHVIEFAERIQVQLHNGVLRDAELVGVDLATDIAVIRINPTRLHPAQRAPEASVSQGDLVFAFGSPFDFRFSMSSGIVSGIGRTAGLDIEYENFIQVDAAINPGNSGGPLTDTAGRVVGMNTAIATSRGGSFNQGQFAGIGLAIPISMIESVVHQLISRGTALKGFMGVTLSILTPSTASNMGFAGRGVLVSDVDSDGPAELAGLRPGDVITHVSDQSVERVEQIQALVSSKAPGETVRLKIWRAAESIVDVGVVLTRLDPVRKWYRILLGQRGFEKFSTSNESRAAALSIPFQPGVLVEAVAPDSWAARRAPVGTIITGVNGMTVADVDGFYQALQTLELPADINITIVRPNGRGPEILMLDVGM